jgi:hypothetical protein
MRTRSSSLLLASAAALLVVAQVGAAVPAVGAEPSWEPEHVVATGNRGSALAVDARSNTWVVWEAHSGAIKIAERPAGGTWGEPTRLVRTNSATADPHVAADAEGNLTVVWIAQRQNFTDGVKAMTRTLLGRWSDPVRISDASGSLDMGPMGRERGGLVGSISR